MNANQIRQDAIRATRGQIRFVGGDPKVATIMEIESACSEVRPEFCKNASNNQWELFMNQFKKWQKED